MRLRSSQLGVELEFRPVALEFGTDTHADAFERKNNKTVLETLSHRRYSMLTDEVVSLFPSKLSMPLGSFLADLKRTGEPYYKRFLNKYGDATYSTFRVVDRSFLNKRGIYAYTVGNDLMYIGRCRDSMSKRINQGYGKIHPKNCYIDGQATNCHLNALITQVRDRVRLWLHELDDVDAIVRLECALISEYQPKWNIQGVALEVS